MIAALLDRLFGRREPEPRSVPREPETWDCTRALWGNTTEVMQVLDDGRLRLVGWHPQAWQFEVGDFVLLAHRDGSTTRYRLDDFKRCHDPRDMWFGTASFAPREVSP